MPSDTAFEVFLATVSPEDFSPVELRLYMHHLKKQQKAVRAANGRKNA